MQSLFDSDAIGNSYAESSGPIVLSGLSASYERREAVLDHIKSSVRSLISIRDRLKFFEMTVDDVYENTPVTNTAIETSSRKVFIVHGHDEAKKLSVARLVESVGLEAIILHEQENSSRTLIEKLEHNSDVAFAIILLTPDDVGGEKNGDHSELQPRARQNVIFEHGFFMGLLGRKNICSLYVKGVELPNDQMGIVYTVFDNEGSWKYKLGREMKAAHLDVDLNKIK
ncbi:MAG: nucleotide-binding protein [candidate division Zixibacteria bacterium]|nr:nucleotide-binding protein [candidate division Zixibacteria bacterium]